MEIKKFYYSMVSGCMGCLGSLFGKMMNYGEVRKTMDISEISSEFIIVRSNVALL